MSEPERIFRGLRGDQPFVPSFCYLDGNMRVEEDGEIWVVDDRTQRMTKEQKSHD